MTLQRDSKKTKKKTNEYTYLYIQTHTHTHFEYVYRFVHVIPLIYYQFSLVNWHGNLC